MRVGSRARLGGRHYQSVIRQSLHYLARPHSTIPRAPIHSSAAWRGDCLGERSDWRVRLSAAEIDELDRAIAHAAASGRPLATMTTVEFPLPRLAAEIRRWAERIHYGLGVVLVQGLPVERWTEREASLAVWGIGLHLGRPGAQNGRGDLLGRVRDQGLSYADPKVRGYATSAALRFHTDFADVVGLACLRPAASGGRSRFVSSVSVYNELLRQRPDLIHHLFEPQLYDTRGDAGIDFLHVIPCRHDAGRLSTLYHGDYLRTAVRHRGAPAIAPAVLELYDCYDAITEAPGLAIDIEFEAGDLQLLSNHTVLHARTAYVDGPEPGDRRDLLRLWLSVEGGGTPWGRLERGRELTRLITEVARAKLRAG